MLLIPLTLVIVFLILLVLLRAVTATLLLMGTVVVELRRGAGRRIGIFDVAFGFPGADPAFPLFAFIFLVALGVDYNIFLMARVREETALHGTREGMLRGLAVTGGVITSAGIVLAGTFAVLAVLPLVFLGEIGFTSRRGPARHVHRALRAGSGTGARHRAQGVVARLAGPSPGPRRGRRAADVEAVEQ